VLPSNLTAPDPSRLSPLPYSPADETAPEPIRLVVGLGNPGARYEQTRHNVGFDVIEKLLEDRDVTRRFFEGGTLLEAEVTGRAVMFLCPSGYMNRSGGPVVRAVRANHLSPQAALLVCDDYALPLGALRTRKRGSDGGHNGLASVLQALGTTEMPRMRLGVGGPPPGVDAADYVLARFGPEEAEARENLIARAAEAVVTAIGEGLDVSMNRFNRTPA